MSELLRGTARHRSAGFEEGLPVGRVGSQAWRIASGVHDHCPGSTSDAAVVDALPEKGWPLTRGGAVVI